MPGLIDLLLNTFKPGSVGATAGQNSLAGMQQGLPPLQGGFTEYGPWGAGGSPKGPGEFPPAPSADLIQTILAHQQAVDPNHTGVSASTGGAGEFPPPPQPMTATHGMSLHGAPQAQQPSAQSSGNGVDASGQKEYSPMFDPEHGPLRMIGRMGGYPTRAEAQARRVGGVQSKAIQEIDKYVKQGMSPQKAIAAYMNSPEGMQAFAQGIDLTEELHNYVVATKGPEADTRSGKDGAVIREQTPGKGDYAQIYTPPPSEKDKLETDKLRSDMQIAADRYKLDVQKYNDEKAQTGVTNDQKERELQLAGDKLNNDATKLGMDLKLGETQIAKSQSDIEQAGKTPVMQDYDRYVKDWKAAHGDTPVDITSDQYKEKYTKLANPAGIQLSPKLDEEAITLSTKADQAGATIQALDNYANIAKGVDTGWVQAASLPIKNMLLSIGVLDEKAAKDVSTLQILESFTSDLALGKRGFNPLSGAVGLTGNTSDKDLNFLIKSVANIWNSPMANAGILLVAKAQARRQAVLSAAKADYIYEHGNLKGWGSTQSGAMHDLIEATPFMTQAEQAQMMELNRNATPNATAGDPRNMAVSPTGATAANAPPPSFEPNAADRLAVWEALDPKFKTRYANPVAKKAAPAPVVPPAPAAPPANNGESMLNTLKQYMPDVQVGPFQPGNAMPEAGGLIDYILGRKSGQ